jgi:hypothetical protein
MDPNGSQGKAEPIAETNISKIAKTEIGQERRALIDDFKAQGKQKGIKITDTMVAKAANSRWNDRTMVTWWKRNDARCKLAHDKRIRAVFQEDPSSLWPKAN